jgi:hypothetical protein
MKIIELSIILTSKLGKTQKYYYTIYIKHLDTIK